jgi:hypothetical protein
MQIQTNTMNKQLEDFKLEMTKKLEENRKSTN